MNPLLKYAEVPPFVEFGYEPKTTFWGDFGVADCYGLSAIKDTYKRSKHYRDDKVYGTELAMVLNHKAWEWDARKDEDKVKLYTELFHELDAYILDHWKGDKLKYYLEVTD